jgi:hypothetical protein
MANTQEVKTSTKTIFEYGAMSSKFSIEAENKLAAYVAICTHYNRSAHLVVIYSPEECKGDQWTSFDGKISKRLDEIFGGPGAFEEYTDKNIDAITEAYKSIKRIV